MDHNLRPRSETSSKSSSSLNEPSLNLNPDRHSFPQFDSRSQIYNGGTKHPFPEFSPPPDNQSHRPYHSNHEVKGSGFALANNPSLDWDPRAMLTNLSILEEKIHQVQGIVRSIVDREGQPSVNLNELAAQQQLVTTDLTCIIIQLISTAGTLLPSMKNTLLSVNPSIGQLGTVLGAPTILGLNNNPPRQHEGLSSELTKVTDYSEPMISLNNCNDEGSKVIPVENHNVKESEDGMDGENLPPGSYEIFQLEKEEILAPHTHFCTICSKGFKRDANLRMHMRGHGDEYKTPEALAKPTKDPSSEPVVVRRYSCPFLGCKRNKEHKRFQPLKTILCVKNHYKRSHCDKSFICGRCNSKKFSVIADLKTHEKHCGREKWQCSCGTTFSRKDKLFGHVALFQGHTPMLHLEEGKPWVGLGLPDRGVVGDAMTKIGDVGYNFSGSSSMDDVDDLQIKGFDDDRSFFSPLNFDSCNFGGFDEFPRPEFDIPVGPFSFLPHGFNQKSGESSAPNHMG